MIMAYFNDPIMSGSAMTHAHFENCLGIYCQYIRGLGSKQFVFYDDVCSSDFDIICLSETRLNYYTSIAICFPINTYFFRSNRLYSNKARGGGGV
jgi:hypothetical protein